MISRSQLINRRNLFVLAAATAGVLTILYAWRLPPFRNGVEATENAYVRGLVTVIAPKVDGYVAEVLVQDFANVKTGQVLVRLDDRIYEQRLAQARSNLAAQETNLANVAQARLARAANVAGTEAAIATGEAQLVNASEQLSRARADHGRSELLVKKGFVSERERDRTESVLNQAEATQKVALATIRQATASRAAAREDLVAVQVNRRAIEANVEAARAAVRLAEIDLENTRIRAPRDGQVGEIGVKLGQYATPGTQLLALVPEQVWVIANFKESQTARMEPGQRAMLRVDALENRELHGIIERISPATGSEFSVIRPDNATGNFTKVVQRLPVRIRIDAQEPLAARLRPGMSVVARVDTSIRGRLRLAEGQQP
jgi:multidrug resistance efflux pump